MYWTFQEPKHFNLCDTSSPVPQATRCQGSNQELDHIYLQQMCVLNEIVHCPLTCLQLPLVQPIANRQQDVWFAVPVSSNNRKPPSPPCSRAHCQQRLIWHTWIKPGHCCTCVCPAATGQVIKPLIPDLQIDVECCGGDDEGGATSKTI